MTMQFINTFPQTFMAIDSVVFFFYHSATPLEGQDLLIVEDSRSHSDTTHSVGLRWTSDYPDAETSAW